jgi:alpha-tubulin suppressor-like RCC1 family protein
MLDVFAISHIPHPTSPQALSLRTAVFFALALAACAEPLTPRTGVPTLDDPGSGNFTDVSAGRDHSCALIADGSAYCWGSSEFGQLGVADDGTTCPRDDRKIPCRTGPIAVAGGLKFQKVSAGGVHTCGLTDNSRIFCWGSNLHGALGDPAVAQSFAPIPIFSTAIFMDVAAGGSHSCGLRTDGTLFCWGGNDFGQLGLGSTTTGSAAPVATSTTQRFASIAAGERRTCGRIPSGTTYCWGLTLVLQGTNETTVIRPQPQQVSPTTFFQSLTVGSNTTCGIALDNRAYCWELNPFGGIGDGSTTGAPAPRLVGSTRSFVAISSGSTQTCAIADDAIAYCWGGGDFGQLGVSPTVLVIRCGEAPDLISCSPTPIRVSGWRLFSRISAGQGDHVCALSLAGNIYCWGAGGLGQRGDGRTSRAEWSPVKIRPI